MIRLFVEIVNFIGCIIAAALLLVGIALVVFCLVVALVAWVCFESSSVLYKAHSPKGVSS